MNTGLVIRNLLIVSAISGVAFLSQQNYFGENKEVKGFDLSLLKQNNVIPGNHYLSNAYEWLNDNVYEKVSGGLKDKEDFLRSEITNQKENLEKKSISAAKKYIAEKFLQNLGINARDLLSDDQLKCLDSSN